MQKAMTTAQTIIEDALAEIGALGIGSSLQAEDADLCLRKLNQILRRWSNMRLMFPVLTEISVPLDGSASYTIGPTGDVVAARPVRVVSARSVDGAGTEYAADVVGQALWDSIAVKDVTGGPVSTVWYQATNTDGTVYVYPKPGATYTLKLRCMVLLEELTLAEEVTLPEGYESALTLALADDISGIYGKPSSPDLRRRATAAIRSVKRTNAEPLILGIDACAPSFEIERGY